MKEIIILSSARKAILARLFSLGRHFCDDDVNEMVSMTVERFYSCGSYDPSKASVQTYVSRIARNVVYEFVKASDRDRGRYTRQDAILERAKNRLSSRYREYYELLSDGSSYEEMATLTGATVSNVSVVAHRMRKQFLTLYKEVA